MSDPIDLTDGFAEAIDGAFERLHPVVIAYVDAAGKPAVSFRGSTQVHGADQIAVWARKPDSGLAASIADRPDVSLTYFDPTGPSPGFFGAKGRARVDASVNEQVYAKMPQPERDRDPEAKGVAVVIDVDAIFGFGADGPFSWTRG
jgi:hypothetical protein